MLKQVLNEAKRAYGLRCPYMECTHFFSEWSSMIDHAEYCECKHEVCPCGQSLILSRAPAHYDACASVVRDPCLTETCGRLLHVADDSGKTFLWEFATAPAYAGLAWFLTGNQ